MGRAERRVSRMIRNEAEKEVKLTGRIVSGARRAAQFTQLDWVEAQCSAKLGFRPYPGTLNIELLPESLLTFLMIQANSGMELTPPDSSFCTASIIPVSLAHVSGALVIPAEEVRIHGRNIVEVIAPVCVREVLGLKDGDEITLVVQARAAAWRHFFPFIRAVIFDLDGTLIDTKEIFFLVIETAFERLRLPAVSRPTLVEAAAEGGFDWDRILPEAFAGRKEEVVHRIQAAIEEISPPLFLERNCLIEGAEELLRTLSAANLALGVVTSTKARHMSLKLGPIKKAGVEKLFQAVVTADDAERQKPAPDPLLECARRLGTAPGQCLYVGDMRMDIRAGKSAGMRTIGVLTGFDTRATLEAEEPDMILNSVAGLKEKLGLVDYQ
ncbi:MAG: hypothetical protein CVU57_14690 [Deltaproteobacteria bacterium HGW-Deltaproteobacteria-15]|jgi:HAD superfamily hydrolase (TIGR01509 family)|nr:MAG: hypothetical protein CVU57_14690 [Deltaproteobacteria bacterium HGW-Deltaproteobacteria-15]